MSNKKCIFCEKDCSGKKRSKEHIFPQHLQREFALLKEKLEHSQFKTVKGAFSGGHISDVPKERSLTFSQFLAGHICASCNNGWMSQLEVSVQPFLYQLMKGERVTQDLTGKEQEVLSNWSCKTSIVLSQSIGAWQHLVPLDHAKQLYSDRGQKLPKPIVIFAYSAQTYNFLWSLCPTWTVETNLNVESPDFRSQYDDAYKIFIQLGRLMILSCHWPNERVDYTYESWGPVPIGGSIYCSRRPLDCRSSFPEESDQFMMAVGVHLVV